MTYNPNIPLPTDFLSDSQPQIRANFAAANASFGINHVSFSTVTNSGKHKFVEMPINTVIPAGLAASEGTIYTKTANAASQVFYTPDASGNEYQLTRAISASFATFATATPGWTFLPGGMLLQWGTNLLAANSATTTISFPVAFTNAASVFNIQISRITNDNSTTAQEVRIKTGSVTAAQFGVIQSSSSATNNIYWMAIGK